MKKVLLTLGLAALVAASVAYIATHYTQHPTTPTQPTNVTAPATQNGSSGVEIGPGTIKIKVSDSTMKEIGDLATGVFNIKPRQEQGTVLIVQATRDITTYSFVEDDQYAERWFKNKHLWSTKQLKMWATYRCNIGIDLTSDFRIKVDGKNVLVQYPLPRVLSTELADFGMWSDDGLWNWISEDERIAMFKELEQQAVVTASRKETLNTAAQRFEDHFRALIQMIDPTLSVTFASDMTAPKE